jgi:hypothetical protein
MVMWIGIVQKEKALENKNEFLDTILERRVKGVISTCNRKPRTLFWYTTNFNYFLGILFNKTWGSVVILIHVYSNT